jgi:hypothetical protein
MELVSSGEEESLLMRMTPHNVPDMSRVELVLKMLFSPYRWS